MQIWSGNTNMLDQWKKREKMYKKMYWLHLSPKGQQNKPKAPLSSFNSTFLKKPLEQSCRWYQWAEFNPRIKNSNYLQQDRKGNFVKVFIHIPALFKSSKCQLSASATSMSSSKNSHSLFSEAILATDCNHSHNLISRVILGVCKLWLGVAGMKEYFFPETLKI